MYDRRGLYPCEDKLGRWQEDLRRFKKKLRAYDIASDRYYRWKTNDLWESEIPLWPGRLEADLEATSEDFYWANERAIRNFASYRKCMWDYYGINGGWLHCCCNSGKWLISGLGVHASVVFGLEMSSLRATCIGQESLEATLSVATYKVGRTVGGGGSYIPWGKVIEAPNVKNLIGKTWGFEMGFSPELAKIFGAGWAREWAWDGSGTRSDTLEFNWAAGVMQAEAAVRFSHTALTEVKGCPKGSVDISPLRVVE